jgi:hypothetical protein
MRSRHPGSPPDIQTVNAIMFTSRSRFVSLTDWRCVPAAHRYKQNATILPWRDVLGSKLLSTSIRTFRRWLPLFRRGGCMIRAPDSWRTLYATSFAKHVHATSRNSMRLCLAASHQLKGLKNAPQMVCPIGCMSKQGFLVLAASLGQHSSLVTSNPGSRIARRSHGNCAG